MKIRTMKIASNITQLIANTPMVELNKLTKGCHARVFAKLESLNPGGSVKDRLALAMIEAAERESRLGDNTTIREFVTINRGTAARGKTVVGSNCLIMAYVHIAHDCLVGSNVILVNSTQLAGEVVVDDWAIIGGMTAIHQFCHIGSHVMISGGSLVRKDVPPFIKAGREPLSYVGINSIGLRRRSYNNDKIREVQEIYRYIYQKGLNTAQAVEIIEAEMSATPERDEILLFVKDSKRGIIRGYFPD